jgi:hypothetical protein
MSVGGNGARGATRGTNTRKGTRRGRGKADEKGRRDDVTMGEHEGVAHGVSRGAGVAKKTKTGGELNPFSNGQGARGRGAVRMGKVVRASADVGVGGKEEKVPRNRHGEGGGAEDDEQDDEEDEVQGSGFRAQGLGLGRMMNKMMKKMRFRAQGSGFRV